MFEITNEAKQFLKEKDPRMKALVEHAPEPEETVIDDAFYALVHIIIGQQISEKVRQFIMARFLERFNPVTKAHLSDYDYTDFHETGVSKAKSRTIETLAKSDVDFEVLKEENKKTIRETLKSFKGIGDWTVDMFFFICLKDPHVLSLKDMGIRITLKKLYDVGDEDLKGFKDYFHPHESAAASYLWKMQELDEKTIEKIKKDVEQ